ncbi:hypothetical protein RLOatenuis_4730 [Rickettsiales bacterium]|nr:hypothetical protein RLOatenuis_4730 [Rickettsiales bacterium]
MPGPLAEPPKKKKPDEEIAPKTQQPAATKPEEKKGVLASIGGKIKNFKENHAIIVRALEGLALGAGAGLLLGPFAVPLGMLVGAVVLGIYGKSEQDQKREEDRKKLFTEPKKTPVENVDEKLLKEPETLKEQQPGNKREAEEVKRDDDEKIRLARSKRKEGRREAKLAKLQKKKNKDAQKQKTQVNAGDEHKQQGQEHPDGIPGLDDGQDITEEVDSIPGLDDGQDITEEVKRVAENLGDAITSTKTPKVEENEARPKTTGRGQGI